MVVHQHPRFTIQSHHVGTTAEVAVIGELDIGTGAELAEALDAAFSASPERIVIDLRQVTFIDSSGLRGLLDTRTRARAQGLDVVVLRPPAPVDRIFEICGLEQEFPRIGVPDVG